MKSDRIAVIDYLRVASALAVITIHTTAEYVKTDDLCFFLNQLSRFAVPLFFILSGMSLYNSYKDCDKINLFEFYKKRLGKVFIPYVLWTFIYLIYLVRNNLSQLTPLFILNKIFLGTGHLYFILIIIQIYLVYPLLFKFYKQNKHLCLILSFLTTLLFNIFVILPVFKIHIIPSTYIKNLYMIFLSWIFFFVFGMYIIDKFNTVTKFTSEHKMWIWCITYIDFMLFLGIGKITNTYASSMKPGILIYSVFTFFALFSVFCKLKVSETIKWLSQQSFAIYLCHMIFLSFLKGYFMLIKFNIENHIGILIGCTVLCSVFFVYMMSFIPFSNHLGIIPNKRN